MKAGFVFMVAIFALMPIQALATPVPQSTANAYYASCMSQSDERLTAEAKEMLCGCVSAKLMTALTMEEIAIMNDKEGPGRVVYDKMLVNAYSTCLQVPVQDQIARECLTDSRIEQFGLADKGALCQCVGRRTGEFVVAQGENVTAEILKAAPTTTDLYQAMLDNGTLRNSAYENVNLCLHNNNQ